MTRILKFIFLGLFIVCVALFVTFYAIEKTTTDNTRPVITVPSEEIELSVTATEADMLAGVTAYDEKDGDLSSRIIVESVSRFIEPSVCRVTYAVCDADNHVATATVRLRYTDYTPPRFTMNRSLCYSLYERVNINAVFGVEDALEGNIKKELKITSDDYVEGVTGEYSIRLEVTNGKGDTSVLQVPLYVEPKDQNAPSIRLTDYLIYLKKGDSIDPMKYLESATDANREDIRSSVTVESELNTGEAGVYSVHYYAADELLRGTHTVLTVIVEE